VPRPSPIPGVRVNHPLTSSCNSERLLIVAEVLIAISPSLDHGQSASPPPAPAAKNASRRGMRWPIAQADLVPSPAKPLTTSDTSASSCSVYTCS